VQSRPAAYRISSWRTSTTKIAILFAAARVLVAVDQVYGGIELIPGIAEIADVGCLLAGDIVVGLEG
jgi:hypothetical protein